MKEKMKKKREKTFHAQLVAGKGEKMEKYGCRHWSNHVVTKILALVARWLAAKSSSSSKSVMAFWKSRLLAACGHSGSPSVKKTETETNEITPHDYSSG